MKMLALTFESGCANLTVLYILLVLLGYYLAALYETVRGLRQGHEHTQRWWVRTVAARFPTREAYLEAKKAPKWFS